MDSAALPAIGELAEAFEATGRVARACAQPALLSFEGEFVLTDYRGYNFPFEFGPDFRNGLCVGLDAPPTSSGSTGTTLLRRHHVRVDFAVEDPDDERVRLRADICSDDADSDEACSEECRQAELKNVGQQPFTVPSRSGRPRGADHVIWRATVRRCRSGPAGGSVCGRRARISSSTVDASAAGRSAHRR